MMLAELPLILTAIPRDRSTLPIEAAEALVRWMAQLSMRELRARQAYAIRVLATLGTKPSTNWHEYEHGAARNAEFDRGVCSAAIDLRTFGDDGGWRAHIPRPTQTNN